MIPRKLNLMFTFFPYSGNGGGAGSEVPDIRRWFTRVMMSLAKDGRIDQVHEVSISDTPITMSRNRAVIEARKRNCDILIMTDSDQHPDLHLGEPETKEFFTSSFDFLYKHYDKGPCVIGAPYCGPPGLRGAENMYVFEWQNYGEHGDDETIFTLEQVPRMLAARMRGIQEAAALPTGLIMYDMRAFDLIEPCKKTRKEILTEVAQGVVTVDQALGLLNQGWFYYEWTDSTASEKASTEDVTNTRDISLAGQVKLGYNPVFCNWDSPVGHWKPWCVRGRPLIHRASDVAATFRNAVLCDIPDDEVLVEASTIKTVGCHVDKKT